MTLDTRISLHKLEVLCAVVETGGVGRAADQLFVRQPVVTAHVRTLEERLGVTLFERVGRGIQPTEEGKAVYGWARELLSRSRELDRELEGMASGAAGSAIIAAGMTAGTYLLPRILIDFHREHPTARVTLTQQVPERALESVSLGNSDFAIMLGERQSQRLGLPDIEQEQLRDEALVLVAAPDADVPECVTVADLGSMRFVCSPEHGSLRRSIIDHELAAVGAGERDVVLALDHPAAIKECVQQGVGVALLFRSSVEAELDQETLRLVDIRGVDLSIPLFLAYRTDKRFAAVQRRLLEHVRAALRSDVAVPVS